MPIIDKVSTVLDKAERASEGAVIGATLGSRGGAPGAAIGATIGAIGGWILGDEKTVFPVDMVCIPAYQAYMIQGQPAFTVYARAGETLMPTGGNVQDVQQAMEQSMPSKKKVKMSKWNRYVKSKKNHIRFKSGKNKGKLDLKKMAKAGGFGKKGGRK